MVLIRAITRQLGHPRPRVRWGIAVGLGALAVAGLELRNELVAPLVGRHLAGLEVFFLALWPLHLVFALAIGMAVDRIIGWLLVAWLAVWMGVALYLAASPTSVAWSGAFYPVYGGSWLLLLLAAFFPVLRETLLSSRSVASNPLRSFRWFVRVPLGAVLLSVGVILSMIADDQAYILRWLSVFGLSELFWLRRLSDLLIVIAAAVWFPTRIAWAATYSVAAILGLYVLASQGGFPEAAKWMAQLLINDGVVAVVLIIAAWVIGSTIQLVRALRRRTHVGHLADSRGV